MPVTLPVLRPSQLSEPFTGPRHREGGGGELVEGHQPYQGAWQSRTTQRGMGRGTTTGLFCIFSYVFLHFSNGFWHFSNGFCNFSYVFWHFSNGLCLFYMVFAFLYMVFAFFYMVFATFYMVFATLYIWFLL